MTTYKMCEEQNTEADSLGWSYCDTKTQEGHYAECECKKSWETDRDDCDLDQINGKKAPHFRGCPKVEDLKELYVAARRFLSRDNVVQLGWRGSVEY